MEWNSRGVVKAIWRTAVPEFVRVQIRRRRAVNQVKHLADRQFMESEIFPWLAKTGTKRLLSIGCWTYTAHYEHELGRHGIELVTCDIEPAARPYGAKQHLTASVTELKPADFNGQFDAILFNGVIGFGLDEQPGIDQGLAALATLAPAGAPMVCGWNVGRGFEPNEYVYGKAGFNETPGPTGEPRVTFETVTHVYDFLQRGAV